MKKIVIGLSGEIAAGKGTAADYLKGNYGAEYLKMSQPGRDVLQRLHKEINRKNMSDINSCLRGLYGEGYLVNVLSKDIENSQSRLVVLDGIRKGDEILEFKSNKDIDFVFVYLVADDMIRYQRLIKRSENSGDEKKSFEEFKKDLKLETEKDIESLKKNADFVVDNSTSLEGLYSQLDGIVDKKCY